MKGSNSRSVADTAISFCIASLSKGDMLSRLAITSMVADVVDKLVGLWRRQVRRSSTITCVVERDISDRRGRKGTSMHLTKFPLQSPPRSTGSRLNAKGSRTSLGAEITECFR